MIYSKSILKYTERKREELEIVRGILNETKASKPSDPSKIDNWNRDCNLLEQRIAMCNELVSLDSQVIPPEIGSMIKLVHDLARCLEDKYE